MCAFTLPLNALAQATHLWLHGAWAQRRARSWYAMLCHKAGLAVQGTVAASMVDREGVVANLEAASSAGRAGTGPAAVQAPVMSGSGSIETG